MKFIGMDAHSNTCFFVVMNSPGKVVAKRRVNTDEGKLLAFVRSVKGKKKLAFEEGVLSQWLYILLKDEVEGGIGDGGRGNRGRGIGDGGRGNRGRRPESAQGIGNGGVRRMGGLSASGLAAGEAEAYKTANQGRRESGAEAGAVSICWGVPVTRLSPSRPLRTRSEMSPRSDHCRFK